MTTHGQGRGIEPGRYNFLKAFGICGVGHEANFTTRDTPRDVGRVRTIAKTEPDRQRHRFTVANINEAATLLLTVTRAMMNRVFSPWTVTMVTNGVEISPRAESMSVIAFHEKAGRSQVDSFLFLVCMLFSSRRVAAVAMLPSALSRSDSFRSVHVGRARFSRCCHLFGALWFCSWRVEPGPGD